MRADGKNLSLVFGSTEVACVSTSVTLEPEDMPADMVTFADVMTGNDKRWFFTVSGYPDYAAGSFWSALWDLTFDTAIPYLFKPYGNDVASTTEPHFSGVVTVDSKPPLGGAANRAWEFDVRLTCTGPPTRVTVPPAELDDEEAVA